MAEAKLPSGFMVFGGGAIRADDVVMVIANPFGDGSQVYLRGGHVVDSTSPPVDVLTAIAACVNNG